MAKFYVLFLVTIVASSFKTSTAISSAVADAGEQSAAVDLSSRRSPLVRRESGAIELDQIETQTDAVDKPHRPHSCKYFNALQGEATCPKKKWVEAMVKADPSPGKIILDIGCNRGSNAIKWMELFDLSPTPLWSMNQWQSFFKNEMHINETEQCPIDPPGTVARHHHPDAYLSTRVFPRVVCVDSDLAKIDALKQAQGIVGKTWTSFGSLHIVHAFVSKEDRVNFANQASDSIYGPVRPPYNGIPTSKAPLATVDSIVSELDLPRVDILTLDLDGTDPDALQGAEATLAGTRYLEFSVQPTWKNNSWVNTTFQTVVSQLDSKGFNCFFAGNRGRLMPIKKCWQEEFEQVEAKVACVSKNDVWATPIGKYSGAW